jgi:hypothetical protein
MTLALLSSDVLDPTYIALTVGEHFDISKP